MSGHFDAGFAGHGFTLFEHWENDGRDLLHVTSDFTAIGEHAVSIVLDALDRRAVGIRTEPTHVQLPSSLQVRGSTAPPARRRAQLRR